MFPFRRKKSVALPSLPPSAPPASTSPAHSPPLESQTAPGAHCFGVKTRIAKAIGKNERYQCGAVRALPSVNKGEVVLQATDGQQATCLLTGGQMSSARLVPPEVLPTRQLTKPMGVRLMGGQWESLDGKSTPDRGQGSGTFPRLGDVLPVVGKHSFCETAAQAQRRRASDPSPSMHIVMGIDLDLLRKTAEALGTTKVTLLVPVPVKDAGKRSPETCVDKPIAVCPATRDADNKGIAVVLPLQPENGTSYYTKVRKIIAASEKRALERAKPSVRRAG